MAEKISICYSIGDIKDFLDKHKEVKVCLYLAHKNEEDWNKSTSRVYMNKIDKSFAYLPVDAQKEDYELIEAVYKLGNENSQIVAINQTQPHKSNPVLKKWFKEKTSPTNVDALIKDENGRLQPFDLNGLSFMEWYEADVGSFEDKQVVVLGVGGVGEPIARQISKRQPKTLFLVDVISKQSLADELSKTVYFSGLDKVPVSSEDIVFINCAGKEGGNETGTEEFLQRYNREGNVFIDLRPQLNLDIVKIADDIGWQAYTGFGMNARNDYTLLSGIFKTISWSMPSFETFQKLVEAAS